MSKDTPTVRGIMALAEQLNLGDRGVLLADFAEFIVRDVVDLVGVDVAREAVHRAVKVGTDRATGPDQTIN